MKNYKLKSYFFSLIIGLIPGLTLGDTKPQDNFAMHVNEQWLKKITSEQKICTAGDEGAQYIRDGFTQRCESKIVPIMLESLLNVDGEAEALNQFKLIDNIKSKKEIPGLIAELRKMGVVTFVDIGTYPDSETGSLIPEIAAPMTPQPHAAVFNSQLTKTVNTIQAQLDSIRDSGNSELTFHTRESLLKLGWKDFFINSGINSNNILIQNDYLDNLGRKVITTNTLEDLKLYFKERFLSKYIHLVTMKENGFTSQQNAVNALIEIFDEDLTKLCFKKYIDSSKPKILDIFNKVVDTYDKDINSNWMDGNTKLLAREKLDKITVVVAYKDEGADYSKLKLDPKDPVHNLIAINQLQYQHILDEFGTPAKDYWLKGRFSYSHANEDSNSMHYTLHKNTIVIPLRAMIPPFFYVNDDYAVNYGAIGTVISHEISHAFDKLGMDYNVHGEHKTWVTRADKAKLDAKLDILSKQYAAYHPHSDLSVSEDAADNLGLREAEAAYLEEERLIPLAIINQTTGHQRFYYAFAEMLRGNKCEEGFVHSPGIYRINAVRNQDGFYKAFGVERDDGMYLSPKDRVNIW